MLWANCLCCTFVPQWTLWRWKVRSSVNVRDKSFHDIRLARLLMVKRIAGIQRVEKTRFSQLGKTMIWNFGCQNLVYTRTEDCSKISLIHSQCQVSRGCRDWQTFFIFFPGNSPAHRIQTPKSLAMGHKLPVCPRNNMKKLPNLRVPSSPLLQAEAGRPAKKDVVPEVIKCHKGMLDTPVIWNN